VSVSQDFVCNTYQRSVDMLVGVFAISVVECLNELFYLQVVTPQTVCLCVSDGSLLPLMAARLGASKVCHHSINSL